jgi:Transcriptional Coactivator p15 (PC4)
MTSPVVYVEWNRSRGEVAWLVLQKFNGKHLLQLRVFYLDEKGELKPTRHKLCGKRKRHSRRNRSPRSETMMGKDNYGDRIP